MTACSYCGKENGDEATHCGGCGTELRSGTNFGFLIGRLSEQELARRALESRQRGGPTYRALLRYSWKPYLFLVGSYAVFLSVLGIMGHWIPFGFLAGVIIAIFYRDWQYIHSQKKVWPFNLKVVDWEKVEAIAKGTPPVENTD